MSTLTMLKTSTPLLVQGLWMTLKLFISISLISLIIGTIIGALTCKRLRSPLAPFLDILTFILRGIPFYVQLLIFYFVLPQITGISFSQTIAGIISLGLCSSAYVAQTIKGGINALSNGQWYAAYVLGYQPLQTIRYIIMPQVIANVLPTLINELEHIVKSTSVISTIGVVELTRAGMNIVSRGADPFAIYLTIACIYLTISFIFNIVMHLVHKRINYVTH